MEYLVPDVDPPPDLSGTRVLLVTRTLGTAYAVQHRLVYQGRWLMEAGAEVLVVGLGESGEAAEMLRQADVPALALGMRHRTWNLGTSRALAQKAAEFGADAIFAQGYDANHHAAVAKLYGAPGGLGIMHITVCKKWHRWLALFALRNMPRLVICQSPAMLEHYRRCILYRPEKLRLLPNGVDVEKFSPAVDGSRVRRELGLDDGGPVLLCVARLELTQKAQDVLLETFARVKQELPDARLLLAGDGPDEKAIRVMAERLGVARDVLFLGKRHDIPELLAAADIFVLLSRWESDCNAVREAAAAGKPIVTTRNAGTYYLHDGEDALLVEPNDAEAAAEAVVRIAQDRELAARLGQAARRLMVKQYSTDVFRRRFFVIIDELRQT